MRRNVLIILVLSTMLGIFISACSSENPRQLEVHTFFYVKMDENYTSHSFLVNLQDGNVDSRDEFLTGAFSLTWSPDGSKIAYVRDQQSVYVMNLNDGSENPIFQGDALGIVNWQDDVLLLKRDELIMDVLNPDRQSFGTKRHIELYVVNPELSSFNKVFDEDFDQSTIFRIVAWRDELNEAFYYYGGIFSEKGDIYSLDFNVGTGTIFVEDSGMSGTLDGNRDRLFYVFKGSSNEQIKYKELSGNGEGMVYNCENSCFSLSWVNGKLLFVDKSISDGTSKIMVAWEENGY